jgi:glycosyltransferase involved in cell wall biosynthesis
MTEDSSNRLVIMTNMLNPHFAHVYEVLSNWTQVIVLTGKTEDNRNWSTGTPSSRFSVREVWGVTLKWHERRSRTKVWEQRYTHINPGYFSQLIRLRPAAIISHEMGFRSLLALIYGRLFFTPVWIWWEGTVHTERRVSRFKRVVRKYLFASLVPNWVTCGESSTEYLESLGIDLSRILTAQNPVDERLYSRTFGTYDFDLPSPVALCVSRLTQLKGIDHLLHATAKLQQQGLTFSLVLVGDGPERESLQDLAEHLGIRNLRWLSHVPFTQMPPIYRGAGFLIFPTLKDVWGLVVNEALLTGLPVIGSRYAGACQDLLPSENIFDPLSESEFLTIYRRAITGCIASPGKTTLKTSAEIAGMVTTRILQTTRNERSPD